MRIFIDARMIIDYLTGIGRYSYNLIDELSRIDRTNQYILLVNDSSLASFIRDKSNFKLEIIKAKPMSILEQFVIPSVLKRKKADLFHAPSFVIPLKLPCRSVITLHDLTHMVFPKEFRGIVQFYYQFIVKPAIKKAEVVITDSENSKKDIITLLNIPRKKVRVTYLAVDTKMKPVEKSVDILRKIKTKYNINKKFILYHGNKKAHKNVLRLIEAFHKLCVERRLDYLLVITGKREIKSRETDFSQIEREVKRFGLDNKVIYTGYISEEDLPLLYNASDLFVYPSLYEGFGLPVLEAMACGIPVVTSNTSSLPEIVGDAGMLVNPYDVNAITGAIYKALTNSELRDQMSKKGLARAKRFSWEKCARETLKLYEGVFK